MIKNSKTILSKKEELIAFYNKYLDLDNDEVLLRMLVNELSDIFITELNIASSTDYFYNLCRDLMDLRHFKKNLASLSYFAKDCLQFYITAPINFKSGEIAYIDQFGTIMSFINNSENEQYLGKDVFEVATELGDDFAKQEATNVILQNILVCKLYNAVKEDIAKKTEASATEIFNLMHESTLSYEKRLVEKGKKLEELKQGYPRIRSER